MKIVYILTILIFLSISYGCATTHDQLVWFNPDTTDDRQFYMARAQCSGMSRSSGSTPTLNENIENNSYQSGFNRGSNMMNAALDRNQQSRIYRDCMRGMGWDLVPESKTKNH